MNLQNYNADTCLAQLNFFLNLDKTLIERSDYTFLMFLGDTGATFGALKSITEVLLFNLVQVQLMFDSFLINQVFRYKKPGTNRTKRLKLSCATWFNGYVIRLLGGVCGA
jgi:hypothetical protein